MKHNWVYNSFSSASVKFTPKHRNFTMRPFTMRPTFTMRPSLRCV